MSNLSDSDGEKETCASAHFHFILFFLIRIGVIDYVLDLFLILLEGSRIIVNLFDFLLSLQIANGFTYLNMSCSYARQY